MTKLRAPLSVDAALARIAGQLPGGWREMAELADRQERTVRNWGDPDTREQIPIDCAIELDLAYQRAGGTGAPIHETYSLQLELAELSRFADRHELLAQAFEVIKEGGEAHAAIVHAARPGATPQDTAEALRECIEAFDALKLILPMLQPPAQLAEGHRPTGPP
ncbi:conserved hypothetical protein [Altererythrobacter sp. B11]|uniref:hypothetical protein n=1 Tax=Altererythrobacter sp. B11 TaxID=2060312 RepID=UPI000DC73AEF|nr:hypothetical protein [Altererythrobacter sp. B11]BBC72895.1 conserved hypothetical protein [Altererythrobacter sp. B11]